MKNKKLLNVINSKNIVIPLYMYKARLKLNIELNEFIFLMYLYSFGEKIIFNPKELSEEYGVSTAEILGYIDALTKANLVGFEITKNDKNISEERLSLTPFLEKLSIILMEEETTKEDNTIFELIEKEERLWLELLRTQTIVA